MTDIPKINKMWGGRFQIGPSDLMTEINASIIFDKRLFAQDIAGSKAHITMLAAQGIVSPADAALIVTGLDEIETEIINGQFVFSTALEDIHMNIEERLKEKIGEAAGRLHTARSRNDQIATDLRLYVRGAIDQIDQQIGKLQHALAHQAEIHAETIMPGFTHLQIAQPISFGHHCLAYVEMLARDRSRFSDARMRLNESPLGAAALAGTSFNIDREATAHALGFDRPMRNSLDAVSDRDFALEVLSACSICAMHLSRLAEEFVLWSTAQFNFIQLSDGFTTGSSIMPQKRNPDAAELVRAKMGRIVGALTSLLIVMKALPLSYSKDMQEDKEPCFEALDSLMLALGAMTGMVADLKVNIVEMHRSAGRNFATATDLADWLVLHLHLPFRDAHHKVGALVQYAEQRSCDLVDLTLQEMQAIEPAITADIYQVLTIEASINSRKSFGGTAFDNVKTQANAWLVRLKEFKI